MSQLASALNSVSAVVRMEKGVEWLGPCHEKGVEWWGQTTGRVDCGTTQMGPLLRTPLRHPSSSRLSPCRDVRKVGSRGAGSSPSKCAPVGGGGGGGGVPIGK